jgi:hypothetical protein
MLALIILFAGTGCRRPSGSAWIATPDQAVIRVSEDAAVAAWIAEVKRQSPQNRAVIDIDSEDALAYIVHVYEIVQDGEDMSHTATFGWYEVSKKAGTVTRTMP